MMAHRQETRRLRYEFPCWKPPKKKRQWTSNMPTRKQKAEVKYTLAANMQIEEKVALLL